MRSKLSASAQHSQVDFIPQRVYASDHNQNPVQSVKKEEYDPPKITIKLAEMEDPFRSRGDRTLYTRMRITSKSCGMSFKTRRENVQANHIS